MYGAPQDVPGECNARLYLGDDYADGTCTCRCTLLEGHDGRHREETRPTVSCSTDAHQVTIEWDGDDRIEETRDRFISECWDTSADNPEEWPPQPTLPDDWDWKAQWRKYQGST